MHISSALLKFIHIMFIHTSTNLSIYRCSHMSISYLRLKCHILFHLKIYMYVSVHKYILSIYISTPTLQLSNYNSSRLSPHSKMGVKLEFLISIYISVVLCILHFLPLNTLIISTLHLFSTFTNLFKFKLFATFLSQTWSVVAPLT